jgi:hypothetical protein
MSSVMKARVCACVRVCVCEAPGSRPASVDTASDFYPGDVGFEFGVENPPIILPLVLLYVCETCTPTLWEEHRLEMFEKKRC